MDQKNGFKCLKHPQQFCDSFTLNQTYDYLLACSDCIQNESIDPSTLVQIENVQKANENQILENWPPLGVMTEYLMKNLQPLVNPLNLISEFETQIEEFFKDFEKSLIEAIQRKKKEILKEQIFDPFSALKTYHRLADIQKLQDIFSSSNDLNQVNIALKEEISKKVESADKNGKLLESSIKEILRNIHLDLKKAEQVQQVMIKQIESISLFNSDISKVEGEDKTDEAKIVSSPYHQFGNGQSMISKQDLNLKRMVTSFIKRSFNGDEYAQLKDPLDNSLNYAIRLNILFNDINPQKIGLVPLKCVHSPWSAMDSVVKFTNRGENIQLNEILKGNNIWANHYYGQSQFGYKSIQVELRICIKDKYFVVLDYPSYQNAISLSNQTKQLLQDNTQYFLGFNLFRLNDSITLLDFRNVDYFPFISG